MSRSPLAQSTFQLCWHGTLLSKIFFSRLFVLCLHFFLQASPPSFIAACSDLLLYFSPFIFTLFSAALIIALVVSSSCLAKFWQVGFGRQICYCRFGLSEVRVESVALSSELQHPMSGRMSSAHRSSSSRIGSHCHCLFHLFVSISAAVESNWRNG